MQALSETEIRLIQAIEEAEEISYPLENGRPQAIVTANTIRRLLLGLPLQIGDELRPVRMCGVGIRIENAIIQGELNLDQGTSSDGSPMPRLSLIECEIPRTILLRSARIRRLCLRNSRITRIYGNDAEIGSIDFAGLRSAGTEQGYGGLGICRVSLRSARILEGMDLRGAHLVSDVQRETYRKYARRWRSALDMPGASVGGDIVMTEGAEAHGGVNLTAAQIEGSFRAGGARITTNLKTALNLSSARIRGALQLDVIRDEGEAESKPFSAVGDLYFRRLQVDNGLNLRGAQIQGDFFGSDMLVGNMINISAIREGNDSFYPFRAERVVLSGTRLDGRLFLSGGQVEGELDARGLEVSGDIIGWEYEEAPLKAEEVLLANSRIGGTFGLDGLVTTFLDLTGATIGSFCSLRRLKADRGEGGTQNGLLLTNTKIGADLLLDAASLSSLTAKNLTTGGDVLLRQRGSLSDGPLQPFSCKGDVNLSGSSIQGDLSLVGARLGGDLKCRGTIIQNALLIALVSHEGRRVLDFSNARIDVLIDRLGHDDSYGPGTTLVLTGLTYNRLGTLDTSTHPARKNEPDSSYGRLRWLRRQYDKSSLKDIRRKYTPDTYNALFKVLKSTGQNEEATEVLIGKLSLERRLTRSPTQRAVLWLYEVLFGFGLRPLRAVQVCIAYYLLVLFLVGYSNSAAKPEFTRIPSPTFENLAGLLRAPIGAIAQNVYAVSAPVLSAFSLKPGVLIVSGTEDVPCDNAINPLLYAADMILPASDFKQVEKCELSSASGLIWSILRLLMTGLGWLICSITLFTWSGSLIRRQTESG